MVTRTVTPKVTVAWCRYCEVYLPEVDIGCRCPEFFCKGTMVKRVGYLCQVGACETLWFTVKDMKRCQHEV